MPEREDMGARLAGLQATVEQYMRNQDAVNAHLAKLCDRHEKAFNGNPEDSDKPGIVVRLDRLEQDSKRRGFIAGAAFVAGVGLVAERLWTVLFSNNPPPH